ncbi:hypothetical protein [Sporosarcina sp. FSL K6-3457]|uniref:hypothetical protein n=1 Tax=Sporosarcina sp. FSL K6-3457 TaxID=2978204 RepID=UPI0030F75AC9
MNLWEAYDEINEYLKETLLTIPPYPSVSGNKVQELLNCLRNPDPAWGGLEGETLRMVINPWQRAYQNEYRFKPSKIFNDSMNVIESATYDLMIGNSISSYLSLVPTVEAILRKWAEEKSSEIKSINKDGNFSIFVFEKHLVQYLKDKNKVRVSNPKFQKWISNQIRYFDYIIKKVFYLRFENSEKGVEKDFNRNRTLHLLDNINEPDVIRDNNTRILLLLDVIAELYLSLDDDLYLKNTFNCNHEDNIDFNLRWKIYHKSAVEAIRFTDMNIIRFAFLEKDKEVSLTDDKKLYFINQKNLQIDVLTKPSVPQKD